MSTTAVFDGECSAFNEEDQGPDFVTTLTRRYKIPRTATADTTGVNLKIGDTLPEDATYQIVKSTLIRAPGNSFHYVEVKAVKDRAWTA